MDKKEPKGKLKVLDCELDQQTHAIFLTIYMEDENKDIWKKRTSSFMFDLELSE